MKKESNEDKFYRLFEERRYLDKEIEKLNEEMNAVEEEILEKEKEFKAQRDLKISISAPRSESILEKIDRRMQDIENGKRSKIDKKNEIAEELRSKILKKAAVQREIDDHHMKYPGLCFRLCR
jgi:uncharacterized protein YdcH (DUF465 family)